MVSGGSVMTNWFGGGQFIISDGSPVQVIRSANAIRSVGILGDDYPFVRAELLVKQGERVVCGTPLFRDRKRPEIIVTAPVSGTVTDIALEARRRLSVITIAAEGNDCRRFDIPDTLERAAAQTLLLESGLWPSFRVRPFGRIPDPGSAPDAIFVTALDTDPHAVDANVVLAGQLEAFTRGVAFIKALTGGPVFVCQSPRENLVHEDDQVRCVHFAGAHPVGLAGTHIHRLFPLHGQRQVWQIHYQDVICLGRLLENGEPFTHRIISLAGPAVANPRLVSVPQGADLDDLVVGELKEGAKHIHSGSALSGRPGRYLGRYHWQVTALFKQQASHRPRWLQALTHSTQPKPVVPTEALEGALGPNIPAAALVRALSVGDVEMAEHLGCRSLLEEDMALLTYVTGGTQDFSVLLRSVLNGMESAS